MELSGDHCIVVSWSRWWERLLDRLEKLKLGTCGAGPCLYGLYLPYLEGFL